MTREETWQSLIELGAVKGDMPKGDWSLSRANLSGANLSGANLSDAYLIDANLSMANLSGADLSEATLNNADLRNANLSNSNLMNAILIKTNLSKANLRGADIRWANLGWANLSDADLSDAELLGAHLIQVNLSEATLRGADMSLANLLDANLVGTDLSDAQLNWTNLSSANLGGANLGSALLVDTNLNRADLSGATLTGSVFHGVSTSGWKIDGVKAEYLYFTADTKNKEKYIRYFAEGKFEELYRSLPTIELIFDQGLNPVEVLKLNAVIEELKQQNPELGLNMSRMSIEQDAARVDIQTPKEENLEEACRVIREALKKAGEQGISVNSIMPQLQQLLPYHDAKSALAAFGDRKIEIQYNYSINLITGGGIITQAVGPQAIAQSITNNIFHQYAENKATIDAKFEELKNELRESSNSHKEHLTALTDRLIEELRAGKDAGTAQKIWEEIKEGVKTGGSIASITSAAMAISKFFG